MQERKTNDPTISAFLRTVSLKLTGQEIPPELIEIICNYALQGTLTREDAERHRLALMSERKVQVKGRYGRVSIILTSKSIAPGRGVITDWFCRKIHIHCVNIEGLRGIYYK